VDELDYPRIEHGRQPGLLHETEPTPAKEERPVSVTARVPVKSMWRISSESALAPDRYFGQGGDVVNRIGVAIVGANVIGPAARPVPAPQLV
jgi:hypothetical protein